MPTIYTSKFPPIPWPTCSVFTALLSLSPSPSHFSTASAKERTSADLAHFTSPPLPEGNVLIGGHKASLPAFIDSATGTTLTRGQLRSLCLRLAAGLRSHSFSTSSPRLRRGDTILIFSPNSLLYPALMLASIAAGLRATLANASYQPSELLHQFHDSGAKVILVHPSLRGVVEQMLRLGKVEKQGEVVVLDDEWLVGSGPGSSKPLEGYTSITKLLQYGELEEEEKFNTEAQYNETCLMCYSSGTTGLPKGVETTHKNLVALTYSLGPVFPPLKYSNGDVMQGMLPLYHIYGAVKLSLYPLHHALPVVLLRGFDPDAWCRSIERFKVTGSLVVPPVLVVLSRHPAVEKYDMTSLRFLMSGAAPLSKQLSEKVRERFKTRGAEVFIIQGYGLTETSPTTHLLPYTHASSHAGSVGLLVPNLEARIVATVHEDGQDGVDAQLEEHGEGKGQFTERGELWIRGPTVMKGYLNNPTSTTSSITRSGWFKTGDVAILDVTTSFYSIVDRFKELIKYKGFQVAPAELEAVLLQHPLIADAAVTAIWDEEQATELPRAFVVRVEGGKLGEEDVKEWVKGKMAPHKRLRGGVDFIDAIPKSAAGKILRRQLKGMAAEKARAKL